MVQGGARKKVKFTYTYRSSDGQRRTAEIEAESRDAAFDRVRAELGIKPIKEVAAVESGGPLGERALPDGREMRAYIAGGGMVEQYLAELEKRQRLEISYRDNAERRLNDMLNGQDARGRDSLKAAYAYWLKANAQLQAMGIYPRALPDALRSYQMSLDIEE